MGATTIGAKGADRIIVDSQTANPLGDDIAGGVRGHAAERCVKWAVIWAVAVGGLQQKALCSTRNVPHKIFNLYSSIGAGTVQHETVSDEVGQTISPSRFPLERKWYGAST